MFGVFFFFLQAEDRIRDGRVTGVQTCALPISRRRAVPGGVAAAGHRWRHHRRGDRRRDHHRRRPPAPLAGPGPGRGPLGWPDRGAGRRGGRGAVPGAARGAAGADRRVAQCVTATARLGSAGDGGRWAGRGLEDRMPGRWGLQAKMTASYVLVTAAAVVLVEVVVAVIVLPRLVSGTDRATQVQLIASDYANTAMELGASLGRLPTAREMRLGEAAPPLGTGQAQATADGTGVAGISKRDKLLRSQVVLLLAPDGRE